jgi:DNA adenine methylase
MDGPLKWHGGKSYLAKRIVALMPPRCKNPNAPAVNDAGWLHYVEPYFGGGAVLLENNPEGISEVANDLNGELTNFWRVLQGEATFNQFLRLVEAIPFSKQEFKNANVNSILDADGYGESVHRAATFFIRCRQSLSGRMDSFAGITRSRTRRGMNEQVSAWLNCIEGLPAVHARLKRVLILNDDALTVIRKEDGPRTLFYLDPPYLHETRATTGEYVHEMSKADHAKLLDLLAGIEGKFLLSGYRSPLYNVVAERRGWNLHTFELPNNAASGKEKRRMAECVWTNY